MYPAGAVRVIMLAASGKNLDGGKSATEVQARASCGQNRGNGSGKTGVSALERPRGRRTGGV